MEGHGIVVAWKQDDLSVVVRYLYYPGPKSSPYTPTHTPGPGSTEGALVLLEAEAAGDLPPAVPGSVTQRALHAHAGRCVSVPLGRCVAVCVCESAVCTHTCRETYSGREPILASGNSARDAVTDTPRFPLSQIQAHPLEPEARQGQPAGVREEKGQRPLPAHHKLSRSTTGKPNKS